MIRHIFRLMWNQKKRHSLIVFEIFIVFLVIFGTIYLLSGDISKRLIPIPIEITDVGTFKLYTDDTNSVNIRKTFVDLDRHLRQLPYVENVCFNRTNIPFDDSYTTSTFNLNGKQLRLFVREVDTNYSRLTSIKLMKGRWPTLAESKMDPIPALLTPEAVDTLFGEGDPIGKVFYRGDRDKPQEQKKYVVYGVTHSFKQTDYDKIEAAIFTVYEPGEGGFGYAGIMVKLKPGGKEFFYKNIEKEIFKVVDGDIWFLWSVSSLEDQRRSINAIYSSRFLSRAIVGVIIIVNVLLGFIGVLWYNTNQRRRELGLRKAFGATSISLRRQLIFESLVINLFGVLPALFILAQVYFMGLYPFEAPIFFFSIVVSILLLSFLIVLAAWYPGKIAGSTQPAVALHAD
ncbi:MAG: FtsX-like permease family protein [Sphingobacteriia bacterium]|nr:FtsX-like permease family protein [Sphingobacteriia bacterium]